ncbi:MAG: hypothetical protein WC666_03520 [Candidatus Paceibacterota bacterium]|jgi:hypothetical protein
MNTATLILLYFTSVVLIGLPIAKLSLWIYSMGKELDVNPHKKRLRLIRSFLFPGSFGYKEHFSKENCHSNYEGLINNIISYNNDPVDELNYLVLVSVLWPFRIFFSLIGLFGAILLCILPSSSSQQK